MEHRYLGCGELESAGIYIGRFNMLVGFCLLLLEIFLILLIGGISGESYFSALFSSKNSFSDRYSLFLWLVFAIFLALHIFSSFRIFSGILMRDYRRILPAVITHGIIVTGTFFVICSNFLEIDFALLGIFLLFDSIMGYNCFILYLIYLKYKDDKPPSYQQHFNNAPIFVASI